MPYAPSVARTACAAAVAQHRVLRGLLAEIEAAFRGKAPRRDMGLDEVAARLDTLRGPLWAHFDEEERAGLFEEIEEKAPEQGPACARLRREHRGLLVRLDALREVPPEARRGREWAHGVRAFLDELGDHERYLLIILLTLIFPLTSWGKTPTFVPQRTVALVFSSNVHGEFEPCG